LGASALCLKADILKRHVEVRYVPKAVIDTSGVWQRQEDGDLDSFLGKSCNSGSELIRPGS
jgi:hypothetical protein